MLKKSVLGFAAIPFAFMVGCSGSDTSSPPGSGGANGLGGAGGTAGAAGADTGGLVSIGGATGAGGAVNTGGLAAVGGALATGGAPATGGAAATGAASGTGGMQASGGAIATGGLNAAGGKSSSGGTPSSGGSKATGGNKATGGVPATGGTKSGGGASSTGGNSSAGGASGSPGCGAATWPAACSTSGSPCSIDVSGTTRQYYVVLPTNYSAAQAYPIVFGFHYLGGSAEAILSSGFYGIRTNFPNAIYISPQGLVGSDGNRGWPNTNGQDVAFTKAMISALETSYCVDKARLFSTGFSYGGIMSDTLGCQMPDVFRAIGVMSGSVFGTCNPAHPIAVWITHGDADTVLAPSGDVTARDAFLKANHCGSTSQPVTPSPCVSYDGCDTGYPVVWCLVAGEGHAMPSFGASAIATFFKQF